MTDPWGLQDRVIMVSGAAGGIGRRVAELMSDAGARLSLNDLVQFPSESSSRTVAFAADISDTEAASAWARVTLDAFGQIDGLVNVAGVWRSEPFIDISASSLRAVVSANFDTAWSACAAVVPHMLERGTGSIVNFSSTAGQFGSIRPGAHYAAAKGAIIAFTKSLAREVSPHGVRVNAIAPGPIDTADAGSGVDFVDSEVASRTLLMRVGTPTEIATAVRFLISDDSSYATGSVLSVNGGSRL